MIIEAERSKAKLNKPAAKDVEYSYSCDDEFFCLSSHVDKSIRDNIQNGKVDFDLRKLIVKRKPSGESKLEIINKEGRSFFVPASEKEIPIINNFKNWKQAFGFFSQVFILRPGLTE